MVFQNHSLLPWLTCFDNVALAVDQVFRHTMSKAERKAWIEHNLDRVQMGHALHKRPGEISGGMKQRVGIARALAMKPKVLLMDEPFGALDALTRAHLQDSVMQIQQALNTTIVLITHDVDEAVLLSDRVLMMTNGPAATVGGSCASICRARATGCSWRTTAAITTCASRSSISSTKTAESGVMRGTMRLVIIGNGMAATRLIASLTGRVPGRFAVTVIGDEPEQAYNRIQLSPVLGGEKQAEHICLHDEDWYTARGVTVLRGETALAVDLNAREVHTSARTLGWDALVFATGSTCCAADPRRRCAACVHLSHPAETRAIQNISGPAVVLGGGVLGLRQRQRWRARVTTSRSCIAVRG